MLKQLLVLPAKKGRKSLNNPKEERKLDGYKGKKKRKSLDNKEGNLNKQKSL